MSSSACFSTLSGNRVERWRGAVLRAAIVSALIPAFKYARYESLLSKVVLAMVTKTKSVKCSMDLAMAWQILALKSRRNCISSVASVTLEADFPFCSDLIVFN